MPFKQPLRANSQVQPQDRVLGLFYPALGLVSYTFDWRKYGRIEGPIHNNRALVEEYGTIFHEIYHYLQLISTSYCYYLFALEQSKAHAYGDLIQYFARRFGPRRVRLPFWAFLNLPDVDARLTAEERQFRDTRFQHGNSSHVLQELLHKDTRLSSITPAIIQQAGGFASDGFRQLHGLPGQSPVNFASQFAYNIEVAGPMAPVDDAGVHVSGEMVLENAAFVISTYPFWHADSKNSTAIVLETIQHYGNTFYTRLIELTARALDIKQAPVLKNTFLALANLALTLPLVAEVDNKPVNWVDLNPGWRFVRALQVARRVKPIVQYGGDHSDFVDRLCRKLHWQTPMEVASTLARAWAQSEAKPSTWIDDEFARAAQEIATCPWKFFDPGDDLFIASDWIARNFPPMVEDTANGNVILTRRKDLGLRILRWYIETRIPERIMLEQSPHVAARGLSRSTINRIIARQAQVLNLGTIQMRALSSYQIKLAYENYSRRHKHHLAPLPRSPVSVFFAS